MRDPSTWKGMWPKETRDRLAVAFVLILTVSAVIFETAVVLPSYHRFATPEWTIHTCIAIFVICNFVGNMYKVMSVDPSGRGADLPSVLRPGWRYCYQCQLNSPPRSYHCQMCDCCILKRDHHCSFGGTCVGYHNHRFYLMCVVWGWVACLYGMWWHWAFIWEALGGFQWGSVWQVFMPHLALITFQIGFVQFFLAGIQTSFMMCLLLSTYLLVVQLFCIWRGHTQVEFRDSIRYYDLGPLLNLQDVLGSRWLLSILCPLLPSPLPGDGLKFPHKTEVENVKDM